MGIDRFIRIHHGCNGEFVRGFLLSTSCQLHCAIAVRRDSGYRVRKRIFGRCNKKTAGQYWPEAANHDHKAFSKLAKCGELQMCIREIWRYKWEFLTVRLDQLRGGSHFTKPVGCEVLPEPPEAAESVAGATK